MQKLAESSQPLLQALAERWSPRAFTGAPLAKEDLLAVLEAARWTASSMNEQPWRFSVATRQAQPAHFERLLGTLAEFNQVWAKQASALIAVTTRRDFEKNGAPNLHAAFDAGAAVASLSIEATGRGLAVHVMGGIDHAGLREALQLPEGVETLVVLALGASAKDQEEARTLLSAPLLERELSPRARHPLETLVSYGPATG